jgi:hypothetical protein
MYKGNILTIKMTNNEIRTGLDILKNLGIIATFPVGKDKRPFAAGWQHCLTAEASDSLWNNYKDNQYYGFVCGPSNGVCIVDFDKLKNTDIQKGLADGMEIYEDWKTKVKTFTVRTGSGGIHMYFQSHPSVGTKSKVNKSTIDIRGGDKGYVVGPGSQHASGTRYTIIDDSPLTPVPDFILEFIMTTAEKNSVTKKADASVLKNNRLIESELKLKQKANDLNSRGEAKAKLTESKLKQKADDLNNRGEAKAKLTESKLKQKADDEEMKLKQEKLDAEASDLKFICDNFHKLKFELTGDEWRNVIFFAKGCNNKDVETACRTWQKASLTQKEVPIPSDWTMDSFEECWNRAWTSSPITIGSFKKWLKDDIVSRIPAVTRGAFSHESYCWNDFLTYAATLTFDDIDIARETLVAEASKVIAILNRSKRQLIIKDSSGATIVNYKTIENYRFLSFVAVDKQRSITAFIDSPKISYADVENYPHTEAEPVTSGDRSFNIFPGYAAKMSKKYDPTHPAVLLFKEHVHDVLSGSCAESNSFITGMLAHMLQKPRIKTRVAMVFYSPEKQIGKNIVLDYLREWIFGVAITAETDGIAEMEDRFNSGLGGKLVVVINEAPATRDNYHTLWDKMKNRITAIRNRIEAKGMDKIEVLDYTNYIITTNNISAVKIEDGDARYFIQQVSSCRKSDYAYFARFDGVKNAESASQIYSYLMNYDISSFDPRDIPYNAVKAEMQKISKPKPEMFIEEIIDKTYELCLTEQEKEWFLLTNEVPTSVLFSNYRRWSEACLFKSMDIVHFARSLGDMVISTRPTINGVRIQCKKIVEKVTLTDTK